MTSEQCNRCKFAPAPGSYSTCTGDDLPVWSCGKEDDPRMPFDMDDDTNCPCFEPADKEDGGHYTCRKCGGYLDTDITIDEEFGYDGNLYVEEEVYCIDCGMRYTRSVVYELMVVHEELDPINDDEEE